MQGRGGRRRRGDGHAAPETQSANELERLAERHDLPIVAVHAPQLLLTRGVFSTNPLEKIRRTAELCKALDVQTIVLHPPYLWQPRYAMWLIHELEDFLQEGGAADHDGEHVSGARRDAGACASTGSGGLHGLERFRARDARHVPPRRLGGGHRRGVPTARRQGRPTSTSRTTAARDATRTRRSARAILPVEDFVRALDGPALRRSRWRSSPAPRTQASADLERLFGESLDLVRKQSAARARTCDRSRRAPRPHYPSGMDAIQPSDRRRSSADSTNGALTELAGRTVQRRVPQGQRAVRPGREPASAAS